MNKIAVIDKNPTNIDYTQYFDFPFDLLHMSSKKVKKLLVKDIDLEFDPEQYDYIITVGADPTKRYAKISSVTNYQGYLVEDKYLPITNPAMLSFKPAGQPAFEVALKNIKNYISGKVISNDKYKTILIDTEKEAHKLIDDLYYGQVSVLALDSETSDLYPRKGYVLGISITFEDNIGYYISSDIIDEDLSTKLMSIFKSTKVIFHNAKFDKHFFKYHFGWEFPDWEDTALLHYCLDEQPGTHGLKQLAIKYTDLGDYDKDLDLFKKDYCSKHGIKKGDFTYDLIPFDILGEYAAKDTIATWELYNKFYNLVQNSNNLRFVYEELLKKGTDAISVVEDNGVPFKKELSINHPQKWEIWS